MSGHPHYVPTSPSDPGHINHEDKYYQNPHHAHTSSPPFGVANTPIAGSNHTTPLQYQPSTIPYNGYYGAHENGYIGQNGNNQQWPHLPDSRPVSTPLPNHPVYAVNRVHSTSRPPKPLPAIPKRASQSTQSTVPSTGQNFSGFSTTHGVNPNHARFAEQISNESTPLQNQHFVAPKADTQFTVNTPITPNTPPLGNGGHYSENLRSPAAPPLIESPIELPADMLLGAVNSDLTGTPSAPHSSHLPPAMTYPEHQNIQMRPAPSTQEVNTGYTHHHSTLNNNQGTLPVTGQNIAILNQQHSSVNEPGSESRASLSSLTLTQHSTGPTGSLSPHKIPFIYSAMLSRVAVAFRSHIVLRMHVKDSLEYKDSFTGREAVDVLSSIIRATDRNLALLLGRALDTQRFFHDVTYEHRLRDNPYEIYQFSNDSGADMDGYREDGSDAEIGTNEISPATDSFPPTKTSRSPQLGATGMDVADVDSDAIPNGVFTLLSDCYSPTCTRETLCYSISCPRRLEHKTRVKAQLDSGLKRSESSSRLPGERKQTLWIESVPKEVSENLSKDELKRQEIIFELIYTEKDFVEDLGILEKLYLEPLRYANITWDTVELNLFISQVFYNIKDIRAVSAPLSQALLKRQAERMVVEKVGDIFLQFVDTFDPFVSYGAHQPYGKHQLDTFTQKYRELPRWLKERERMPESRKLPIQSFLGRPTSRLARYPLLLEAVIKATPENHPDQRDLPVVIEKIRTLLKCINVEAGKADTRIRLTRLNEELTCSPNDLRDLNLLNPARQLILEGALKRGANVDVEMTMFLFDHCLLLAKKTKARDGGGYKVYKRPIPLEMISLATADEPGLLQSTRRPSSIFSGSKTLNVTSPTLAPTRNNDQNKGGFPLTLTHLGRNGMEIVLYASSQAEHWQWRGKIEAQRELLVRSRQIFQVVTLTDTHFRKNVRVNCSAVFDNGRKIALGTDDGIYVGIQERPESIGKTLDLDKVHRIEILEEYNMVLALHGKNKNLMSYPMDCLKGFEAASAKRNGRKIASHASYFKVGKSMNRTLVCVVNSAALYSTIKAMEPVSAMVNKKKSLGTILRSSEPMKVYREFYIPTESSSIHFLKTKLCVGCNKGFEVVDLESLNTLGLLDPSDESLNFVLKRDNARPVSIFRIRNGDFLLCYDEFGFFVNRNGRRSRPGWLVTWEGTPNAFALSYPYIIAFDNKFIEVRHVETGGLEQVIPTGQLRCLNTHADSIHAVTIGRQDYQHVFKLQRDEEQFPTQYGGSGW